MVSIIDGHAGLVGQTCRFAPIKKPPCLPMLPSKIPHEPNWEGWQHAVPNPYVAMNQSPRTKSLSGNPAGAWRSLFFIRAHRSIRGLKTSPISGDLR
ncbi:MAG: hypothetical protein ABSF34_05130 [Verrucomicrobiota bacterium]|jgi:hypothetical protein